MKLYLTNETNPYYNLAAEEYLLRRSDDDIFMLWQNEPSVIIGKNQDLYQEVRPEILEKRGIHVARRITGGGAVYHDLGNVNYSFLTSDSRAKILDFAFFTEPIRKALRELGLETSLSGRNDLLVKMARSGTPSFPETRKRRRSTGSFITGRSCSIRIFRFFRRY